MNKTQRLLRIGSTMALAIACAALVLPSNAQQKQAHKSLPPMMSQDAVKLPVDTAISTQHEVTVEGKRFSYTATVGTQPVWDDDGKVIASLFYVYYTRNDVKDRANRPLVLSFNGGPGTASVWMNIGFTGPRRLNIDDEGYPLQPYGVQENPYSILDVADIVFVCPVNTGFSRIVDKSVDKSVFFGVNADIKYLSRWLADFVSRNKRWASPKFIIGESYGTTRVSGLAYALQGSEWMYLNGVILVSPTELGIERPGPVGEALMLPYYAATAWYHKALPSDLQQKTLTDLLPQVEKFTIDQYIPALTRGGTISDQQRQQIASQVSKYSGLAEKHVLQHNLIISPSYFWKDLLRDKGYTIGRLDSRYLGIDGEDGGERTDYNPEITSWLDSFTPAINSYLRDDLGFKTDLKYYMFGPVHPWDRTNNHTGEQLGKAMRSNPALHLMVLSGYFDGACDFFNAQYNMWQIDKNGKLKDRMEWHGFESGHMMYLRKDDGKKASDMIRAFIKKSVPGPDQPIKYQSPR